MKLIVDRHGRALVLYARQWCDDPDEALQQSLIELATAEPVPVNPVGWLYTCVRRRAINLARSSQRRRRYEANAQAARDTDGSDWFDDSPHMPADSLAKALQSLEPTAREIVVAKIWGQRSFAQIAEQMRMPRSSVHRHYQTAINQMRSFFDSQIANSAPKGS